MFIEEELRNEYDSKYPAYLKLGQVLESKINSSLRAKEINYDYVQMRVKSFLSFFEKIDRNIKWKNPFQENDDFCGLRIIHLFNDDLDDILKILRREFEVIREYNPSITRPQTEKEFTYRSYHVLLKLKGPLASNNVKIKDLSAEVQIRTISMHTWAAIEHKLNYKQQKHFPPDFRPIINRKFSQMSAVLEIADEFFVSLRNEKRKNIEDYKAGLKKIATKEEILNDQLNIDALQAYLENKFSKFSVENKNEKNKKMRYFLNEMILTNLTLKSIEDGEKVLIQKKLLSKLTSEYPDEKITQTGMARLILDITNEKFYKMRKAKLTSNSAWITFVNSIREKL